jgi:transposase
MNTGKRSPGRKGQKGYTRHDITFMRFVAREYINGDQSTTQLASQFGIPQQTISRWVKRFKDELAQEQVIVMTEEEQKQVESLQKQVEVLKKKLEYEQMKNFALETMADLAKTELGIDIRKNSGAKQPKE